MSSVFVAQESALDPVLYLLQVLQSTIHFAVQKLVPMVVKCPTFYSRVPKTYLSGVQALLCT